MSKVTATFDFEIKEAKAAIKQLEKEFANLSIQEKKNLKVTDELFQKRKALAKEIIKHQVASAKYRKDLRDESKLTGVQTGSIAKLRYETNKLVAQRDNLNLKSKANRKEFKRLTKEIDKNTDSLKKFDKQIGRSQRNVGNYGASLKSLFKTMATGAGLYALIRGFRSLTSTIADFEQSMANAKAVIQPTSEEFEHMTDVARELAKVTKFTATEAAEAYKFLGQAGLNANEAIIALPQTLQLAAAGSLELAEAADISTNVLAGMRLSVNDLSRVNDVLAKTAADSNTNISELGQAFRVAAPLAASTGQSIEEVAVVMGAMANNGIKAENAGHAVAQMMTRLLKPTSTANKTLTRLGVALKDTEGRTRPLTDVLKDLNKSSISSSDAIDIFGKRTAKSALAALGAEKDIDKLRLSIENASGAAKEMADIKMDTLTGDMLKLKSAWDEVQLSASGSSKTMRNAIQTLTKLISYIDLSKSFRLVSGVLGGLVGTIVFFGESVYNSMQLLTKVLIAPFTTMWEVARETIKNISQSLELLGAGEFTAAYNRVKDVSKIKDAMTSAFDGIKGEYQDLSDSAERFAQVSSKAWDDIIGKTEEARKKINPKDIKGKAPDSGSKTEESTGIERAELFFKEYQDVAPLELIDIENLDDGNIKLEEFATTGERVSESLKASFTGIAESGLKSFISAGLKGANALETGFNALKNSVIDLAATLASKAAIFGLLNLFTGGTGGTLLSFLGFKQGGVVPQKLAKGGVARGRSHAAGGIDLLKNGRQTGIEIEGGEPVLTKAVSQNPSLLQRASDINVEAGGSPLTSSSHMAQGGIANLPSGNNNGEIMKALNNIADTVAAGANMNGDTLQGILEKPLAIIQRITDKQIHEANKQGEKDSNYTTGAK